MYPPSESPAHRAEPPARVGYSQPLRLESPRRANSRSQPAHPRLYVPTPRSSSALPREVAALSPLWQTPRFWRAASPLPPSAAPPLSVLHPPLVSWKPHTPQTRPPAGMRAPVPRPSLEPGGPFPAPAPFPSRTLHPPSPRFPPPHPPPP